MRIWVLLILLLAGVLCIGVIAGATLPPTREGRSRIEISAAPHTVRATLLAVVDQPQWRSSVAAVSTTPIGWIETTHRGERIAFRWTEIAPNRLALEFNSDAGYEGEWIADLEPTTKGTVVSIIERATVNNLFRRILARLFFDPGAIATTYLAELKHRVESTNAQSEEADKLASPLR